MYKLFNVLCWLFNIYEGVELPSVYFITNTKYCITYLALTQLFPVFWQAGFTSWNIRIMYYFDAFQLGFCHSFLAMDALTMLTWDKWLLLADFC